MIRLLTGGSPKAGGAKKYRFCLAAYFRRLAAYALRSLPVIPAAASTASSHAISISRLHRTQAIHAAGLNQ